MSRPGDHTSWGDILGLTFLAVWGVASLPWHVAKALWRNR